MSLTSYRTAPPRVTDFSFRSDPGKSPRNDFAALSGRCGRTHNQPAEPRICASGGCEDLEGGLALRESDMRLALQTWQRSTLPCLKTQYHRRWGT